MSRPGMTGTFQVDRALDRAEGLGLTMERTVWVPTTLLRLDRCGGTFLLTTVRADDYVS
jgi:hypothetical protein